MALRDASDVLSRIWRAFDEGEILPACAWCGHVKVDEAWVLPPRAVLAAIDERYTFSHSICDECAEELKAWTSREPATALDRFPDARDEEI